MVWLDSLFLTVFMLEWTDEQEPRRNKRFHNVVWRRNHSEVYYSQQWSAKLNQVTHIGSSKLWGKGRRKLTNEEDSDISLVGCSLLCQFSVYSPTTSCHPIKETAAQTHNSYITCGACSGSDYVINTTQSQLCLYNKLAVTRSYADHLTDGFSW